MKIFFLRSYKDRRYDEMVSQKKAWFAVGFFVVVVIVVTLF